MMILGGKRHAFLFPPCVLHGSVHPGKILRHLRWMQEQTSHKHPPRVYELGRHECPGVTARCAVRRHRHQHLQGARALR